MATAELVKISVPQPPVVEDRISLHLTKDEAQTLVDIGSYIGGDPEFTRREHVNNIRAALVSTARVSYREPSDISPRSGIYFV